MFQIYHISGLTGSKEDPGLFQEDLIVREGTEETMPLSVSVIREISPHRMETGEQAYFLLGVGAV